MSFEDSVNTQPSRSNDYYDRDDEASPQRAPEKRSESRTDLAGSLLGKDFFGDLGQTARFVKDRFSAQLDEKLAKLFDGDRPLEIKCGDKPAAKQDWLVVMNMATDFGGECTIEKRTKKLQELAAQTEGKNVTIVVQATAQNETTGKYELKRFVLKDGKVTELKSPGESKGYGADVEDLVKYATKNYQCKNLGLILDSHGHGNEGLTGDVGDLSLVDFKKHIKSALEGSGHEKLDFLQFDACLMAQNGVLESTKDLAKHIVASAEPEGVTADTAAADNTNLAALLKNPSMTPDELAEFCVKQAKDVNGFDTLAHFDMEKYDKFRGSLDKFGEGLAKIWEDPKQQAVLKEIIQSTFEYGGHGQFHAIFDTINGKEKPRLNSPASPSDSGPDSAPESRPQSLLDRFGSLLDMERPLLNHYLNDFPIRKTLSSANRDLKEFVEKVVKAIDEGKLKDEGGKLKEAAQQLLKDASALTKSYFGRGEHAKLGGLSVELGFGGEPATISTAGGWRQFQKLLHAGEKAKK